MLFLLSVASVYLIQYDPEPAISAWIHPIVCLRCQDKVGTKKCKNSLLESLHSLNQTKSSLFQFCFRAHTICPVHYQQRQITITELLSFDCWLHSSLSRPRCVLYTWLANIKLGGTIPQEADRPLIPSGIIGPLGPHPPTPSYPDHISWANIDTAT